MGFVQAPPGLGNQYSDDRVLCKFLARALRADEPHDATPQLTRLGELARGELYVQQLAERTLEPALVQWDPWGNCIETTPLWRRGASAPQASI